MVLVQTEESEIHKRNLDIGKVLQDLGGVFRGLF